MVKYRRPKQLKYKDAKRLDEIEELLRTGKREDAKDAILAFTKRRSDVIEGWELMLEVADTLNEDFLGWLAARNLLALDRDNETNAYNMIAASMKMGNPLSIHYYIEYYLKQWPDGAFVSRCREFQHDMKPMWDALLQEPMARDSRLEDLVLFEEGRTLVSNSYLKEGRALSREAAKKIPGFASPLNNVCLSYMVEGSLEKALKVTEDILAKFPDTVFTQCLKAQCLIRLGRNAEAQPVLETLKQASPKNSDYWLKILETLAYAGDDDGIIAVYERAIETVGGQENLFGHAHHHAAVAYAHSGQRDKARQLWRDAAKDMPGADIFQQNAMDSTMPEGLRNGAWHFDSSMWVSHAWMEQLLKTIQRTVKRSATATDRAVERVFKSNPGFREGLELMLKHGGPDSRDFVLSIATNIPIPGLVEFALGRGGTDAQRNQAARQATDHGLIDNSEPVTIYVKGEPTEVLMMSFDIAPDLVPIQLTGEALECVYEAQDWLFEEGYDDALEWIEDGLKSAPDAPELLYQKARALLGLQRLDEVATIVQTLEARHSNYPFTPIARGRLLTAQNKPEEAEEVVRSALKKGAFYRDEFEALMETLIDSYLAQDNRGAAKSWLEMWQGIEPDYLPSKYDDLLDD